MLKIIQFKDTEDKKQQLQAYADKYFNGNLSDALRHLTNMALSVKLMEENIELISSIVRNNMEVVLKPSIERLAKLSSKTGHMSATSVFLQLEALDKFIPKDRRIDLIDTYKAARKKGAAYMKTPLDKLDEEALVKE